MSLSKVKRVSKKNKSAWRKTDINDVEEFLEEQRQEERIGSFNTKKDEDLFVVDTSPALKHGGLTEKQKRKLNAKKPLKSLEPLINRSKVQDPITKRNIVKKKSGRIIENEILNPTKPRHFQANRDRSRYYEEVDNKIRNKKNGLVKVNEDLWTEKDFRDELPGLKDEKGWVSRELALHIANNVGKKVIKVHDGLRHRTTKAKNFEIPHPGISYNPSLIDHQDLIQKVVEREENIIKEEKHLKRVTTQMFSKVTPEERDRRRIEEMSAGLEEPDENIVNSDVEGDPTSINPPVQNKKKTKQDRNKELRHRKLLKQHEMKKALKRHIADLNRVKSLRAEVLAEEEELNELKKRRKKTALKKKFEPKRLARLKYVEPDADVNMAEDIAGNLRNLKTESSLLVDRFKSFQKRNILAASVATGKQKAKKIKRFLRSSHKDPGVSYQMLREQRKQNTTK